MVIIDKIIKDLEDLKNEFQYENNYCLNMFNSLIDKNTINEDIYHSAKAFTSIINSLVNKKIEYANYIIYSQIELLNFLNTYDDKYLSNIYCLLSEKATTEGMLVSELSEDIFELTQFLEDFLTNLNTIKKRNKLPKHLQQQLDKINKKNKKKYEGGTNDEQ